MNQPFSCIVCDSSDSQMLFASRDPGDHGNIVRCRECAHTFVSPMPTAEQIGLYYRGLYADKANEFSHQQMKLAERSMAGYRAALQNLGSWNEEARFLDLGGGLGYYAAAAQKQGLRTTLVDIDPCSVEFVSKHHYLSNVFLGSTEEFANSTDEKFDVVFLRHVVEHYIDPRSLIGSARSLLAENGILIVETDNNAGIEMLVHPGTREWYLKHYQDRFHHVSFGSLLRKRPFAVDPPRHLHGFTLPNLTRLLESFDLRSRKGFSYCLGDPVYWPNIPDITLRNCASAVYQMRPGEAVRQLCGYTLAPFRRLLAKTGHASGLCIYASHS